MRHRREGRGAELGLGCAVVVGRRAVVGKVVVSETAARGAPGFDAFAVV